jgi:hypothetical protein
MRKIERGFWYQNSLPDDETDGKMHSDDDVGAPPFVSV